eukprot:gene5300-6444_t
MAAQHQTGGGDGTTLVTGGKRQVIDENLGSTQKQVMSESDSISQVELRLDAEEARLTGMEKLVNEDVSETLSMLNHGLNVELKKTIRELQDQLEREISARERLNLNLTNTLDNHVDYLEGDNHIDYLEIWISKSLVQSSRDLEEDHHLDYLEGDK